MWLSLGQNLARFGRDALCGYFGQVLQKKKLEIVSELAPIKCFYDIMAAYCNGCLVRSKVT